MQTDFNRNIVNMKHTLFLTLFLALNALTGCKKEGCTDPNSRNYNASANSENGSCEYDGSLIFWCMPGNILEQNGVSIVTIKVNGQTVGSLPTSSSQLVAPPCGTTGVTYYLDMGSNKTKIVSYEVLNSTFSPGGGPVILTGTIQLKGGQCVDYKFQ